MRVIKVDLMKDPEKKIAEIKRKMQASIDDSWKRVQETYESVQNRGLKADVLAIALHERLEAGERPTRPEWVDPDIWNHLLRRYSR